MDDAIINNTLPQIQGQTTQYNYQQTPSTHSDSPASPCHSPLSSATMPNVEDKAMKRNKPPNLKLTTKALWTAKAKYISFLAQLNKHIWYSSHSGTKVCWHWFRQQGSNWKASEGDCRGWKEALCHKRRSSHWCSLQECCWWAEAMGLLHQHLPHLCKIQQSSPGGTQPQCLLCEGI